MSWLGFWGSCASIIGIIFAVVRYFLKIFWSFRKALAKGQEDYERFVESIKKTGSTVSARGDLSTYVLLDLAKHQRLMLCCIGVGGGLFSLACLAFHLFQCLFSAEAFLEESGQLGDMELVVALFLLSSMSLMVVILLTLLVFLAYRICVRMEFLENQMLDLWQNEVEKRLEKIAPDETALE